MRVLLDTNVILDALLQRMPWRVEAEQILNAAAAGRLGCATTSLSLATLFYVGRRMLGATQARMAVRDCLNAFHVLAVDAQTLIDADAFPGADFEDNIQIAAAVQAGLDAIVTRDPVGFAGSPLTIYSPSDLLQQLPP